MLKLNVLIYVWLARLVPWRSTRLDGTLCCQPRSWHRRGTVQRRNTESCGLGRVSPADTSSDSKSEGKTIVDILIYQRLEETHLANLTQTDLHLIRDISLTFGHKNCLKKKVRDTGQMIESDVAENKYELPFFTHTKKQNNQTNGFEGSISNQLCYLLHYVSEIPSFFSLRKKHLCDFRIIKP